MATCRLGAISLMQRTKCVEVVDVEDRSSEGAGSEVHRLHQSITEGIRGWEDNFASQGSER